MAEPIFVEHAADPRLDDFRDLTVADRRPDRPGGRGAVVAEGVVVVRRMLTSPYPVRAILGVAARVDDLRANLSTMDVPAYVVTPQVMSDAVGFHLNRGVLAVADRPIPPPIGNLLTGDRLLILEGVNDHENLGALFRNAAALGTEAVLLGDRCSDPLYRRSVRVSMGHVLGVPFATMPRWPADLAAVRAAGLCVMALTPQAGATPLAAFDPAAHRRVALLVGAEGPGLSVAALAAADVRVRIPMAAGVDSLNVGAAAAVACWVLGRRPT